jgi:hypothetical protein
MRWSHATTKWNNDVDDIAKIFSERGDLAHLALFLWASGASALLVWALKELAASNRRFNDFVSEIARLTRYFDRD